MTPRSLGSMLVFGMLFVIVSLGGFLRGGSVAAFQLSSSAFSNGGMIPQKFTCNGPDVSPALSWNEPPNGAQAFALIMDDPDAPAGTWVHWVLYDLPADTRELPEGVSKTREISAGARQGQNDFGRIGYGGPCPPSGSTHRYSFRLYALDRPTGLKAGATKAELERAIKGRVLAQAELLGRFQR